MEDVGIIDDNLQDGGYTLNMQDRQYLAEVAKWARFLSIVGFVGIGLMVVGSLFVGVGFSAMDLGNGLSGGLIAILYLIIALIYVIPIYYLYSFANNMRSAMIANRPDQLTRAFEFLKSHYKFIGIMVIIMLVLYGIAFLFMAVAGISTF